MVTRQCAWAHPRSRGENRLDAHVAVIGFGSSPLTRGKPGAGLELDLRPRLIPAHAGKTSSPPSWEPGRAAHPRSRGENFLIVNVERKVDGSSPLTRGKRHEVRGQGCAAGLIPAHAGKTGRWRSRSGVWTAHPRSRGENALPGLALPRTRGSSPLTRGKRGGGDPGVASGRLIPAHAGKTSRARREPDPHTAHPRSRGENDEDASGGVGEAGSSPLTRGKPS